MLLFKNNFSYKIIYILFLLYYFNYKLYEKSVNRNNKNENQSIDISYVKSLKKVVYSALFGNYDKLYPINKENGYDYFLFTNQILTNTLTNWTILNVEKNLNFSNRREVIKTQRFYKTHPHLFFKNYDLSIYIDTTYEIKGELDYFLLRILTPKIGIYVYEHPGILTIYKYLYHNYIY